MNSTTSFTRRSRLVAGLLWATCLLVLSIYLGSIYSLPLVGANQYAVVPSHASVVWYQDAGLAPKMLEQLDLRTGLIGRLHTDEVSVSDTVRNSRGQRIVLRRTLEIFDDRSGRSLWSGPMPFEFPYVVGDHYLIEAGDSEFTILDLDLLIETGVQTPQSTPMSGVMNLGGLGTIANDLQPIPGTNRFLYHFRDANNANVTVFEIDGGQLQTITSWPTVGDSMVHQYNGMVITAAPLTAEVEVRSLEDFQLIKKLPLPAGMAAWGDSTSSTAISNDLFSFAEVKTGFTRVGRLDDFTLVPELNLPVLVSVLKSVDPNEKRFVLLGEPQGKPTRVIVYDTQNRRVVVDQMVPIGCVDQRIAAGHLVFVSELLGLTVDMIDLQSGLLARRFQPFAWVVVALPAILLLALGWLIFWMRATAPWPNLAVLNIVFIAAVFVTPLLAHVALFGLSRILFRPSMGYCCVTLLALTLCLSLYVVYGQQRILLRTVPVWIGLAIALGLANLYVGETGRRGLAGMTGMAGAAMRLLVIVSVVSIVVLACMRSMGFGIARKSQSASLPGNKATLPLRDIFVFTACIAAFVAAAAPNRVFLLQPGRSCGPSSGRYWSWPLRCWV